MASIVNQKVEMLDEDLAYMVDADSLKRKEIITAVRAYLEEEDLFGKNKNHFHPDALIKGLIKQIKLPAKKEMTVASLLKLFGGVARDAGLVDY